MLSFYPGVPCFSKLSQNDLQYSVLGVLKFKTAKTFPRRDFLNPLFPHKPIIYANQMTVFLAHGPLKSWIHAVSRSS